MSVKTDPSRQSQNPQEQPRPRRGLSAAIVFTAIAFLVGIVVIAIAMTRQDISGVDFDKDGVKVHFIPSAAGEEVTEADVTEADLGQEFDQLQEQAQSQATSAATWQQYRWLGNNGLTYEFAAYGDQLVFQEVSPGYGVTAVGSGTRSQTGVQGTYQAADGSIGEMDLLLQPGDLTTLSGEFRNITHQTVVPIVMREQ
jgi:hypothetical protein